eukprot:gnl/TRDRNA2_/TRDRNA2_27439_c0_seq1.p1 gnl/TRDRNA2_/TRDRNA2_27439_c0~~gnl/TRDRNA2_/TRDRNA2_27439_c0_seq1.p1  ORF type:complete len:481 (-),score=68.36 gnl/TRDRNA2_/TRDRNA2_27439_c0_seq1:23-1249(-)
MQRLAEESRTLPVKQETAGASGASIFAQYRDFVVKATDADELGMLPKVLQKFREDITRREGCYSTALAPICVAVTLKDGSIWMALRKVSLPGATPKSFDVRGTPEVRFDLKGPKFTKWDGKSVFAKVFGKENLSWKLKDPGFIDIFPNGISLKIEGSKEVAYTLLKDSRMLMRNEMTDYSLYGEYYKSSEHPYLCDGTPRFPLILHVDSEKMGGQYADFKLVALGIIDYLEQHVASFFKRALSTMLKPNTFREYWERMWPRYFRLPKVFLEAGACRPTGEKFVSTATASDRQCRSLTTKAQNGESRETFSLGDKVIAVAEIKYASSSTKTKLVVPGTESNWRGKSYFKYITNSFVGTGSDAKVEAGTTGTIVAFDMHDYDHIILMVKWEGLSNSKLYAVNPEEVVRDT